MPRGGCRVFFNRTSLILVAGFALVLSSQISAAKDYPIGTVFNDIIEFDFPGTRLKAPLPPGDWKLLSKSTWRSDLSNVVVRSHFLIRHDKKFVTGITRIRVPIESVEFAWSISSDCSEKRKKRAWYFHEDSYRKHEDCAVIYPTRGFKKSFKPLQKTFQYIENNGLTIPNVWVGGRFTRTDKEDLLRIGLWLPQEHYGFPREQKYSSTRSPWNINNIDSFPKKKAFMEKARAWAKSWKGLIYKGFKNELRREEVLAHPKIDGSFTRPPKKAARAIKAPKATGSDAETRLKKLQRLLDKKLISPEEYRDQRKKILDRL